MKFEIQRDRILIIPQNEQDNAYIEERLGLKQANDEITARRIDAVGLFKIKYIQVAKLK